MAESPILAAYAAANTVQGAQPANAADADAAGAAGLADQLLPLDLAPPAAGGDAPPSARRPRVLLALTGSVAAVKAAPLAAALCAFADVRVVATAAALHFFDPAALPPACGPVLTDADDWRRWRAVGDPVAHIELRRWADALVVAPLSANTLAKVANGLCDNLATCVVRAWDFRRPLLAAPAMNTLMWESPFTARHLREAAALGVRVVPPVSKRLACGEVGAGGMAEVGDVAAACAAALREAGFECSAAGAEEAVRAPTTGESGDAPPAV